MVEQTPLHAAKAGTVTATVYQVNGFTPDFQVELSTNENSEATFSFEELPMVQEAAEQARLFICLQEQIARMNWCPSCGDA